MGARARRSARKGGKGERELLEGLVLRHRALYFRGAPEIGDDAFDRLEERLRALDPDSKVLGLVGSEVGSPGKIRHARRMLSLAKVRDKGELERWRGGREVVSTWKIDGVGCSLVYGDGLLGLAKTRGDGTFGEDVTEKARWVPSIPGSLPPAGGRPPSVEVRGELFCSRGAFGRLADEMEAGGLPRPANRRNIVAGLLGRKDGIELCRHLSFRAFDVLADPPPATEVEKAALLSSWSFDAPGPLLHADAGSVGRAIEEAARWMGSGDYAIDGVVFTFNDTSLQESMGETEHHPRYKMAFKFRGEERETAVLGIEWQVSRNGVLTPVAHVEPVDLAGARIGRVTLHNCAVVREHGLGRGSRIRIVRSGEVIPKFVSVAAPAAGGAEVPDRCPSCGGGVVEDDVRLRCGNGDCPGRRMEGVLHFVRTIGIDDVSGKRLAEMVRAGLVRDVPDLYDLTVEQLLSLDKTKERLAEKIHRRIRATRRTDLATFLAALGLQGGALPTCRKVVRAGFDSIDKVLALEPGDLLSVEGFAEKSAGDFVASLGERRAVVERLLAAGFAFEEDGPAAGGLLAGKRVCVTGTLSEKRSVVEGRLRAAGAVVVGSVGKSTDVLVAGDGGGAPSSKLARARALGVRIVSEKGLADLLGGGGG